MARSKTILQSQFPYHVTARAHNKQRFDLPIEEVWEIMCRELYFITVVYEVKIHSFVLMNNHFHLLVSTPNANIDKSLWHFMSATSRQINEPAGKINQVYGARYFKCVIESYHYFLHAYKYVYRNPVHAGLCEKCEDYRFSTANGLLGQSRLVVPLAEDTLMFPDPEFNLGWLNRKPSPDQWVEVGKAMQKNKFCLSRNDTYTNQYLNLNTL